jgi:nucleoside-diphosphate-sugar epimerase
VKLGKPVKTVSRPSSPGIGHAWAYLPDVAQTMLALLEKRSALDAFASFHFAGHWDASGSALADSICRVVTARTGETPRVTSFPWWLIYALSPFITTFREMLEMRYLWRQPVRLDNSKLVATLGQEPHTPLDRAVEITLDSMENLGTSRSSDSVIAESRL